MPFIPRLDSFIQHHAERIATMSTPTIKTVCVLGATGSIGPAVVTALLVSPESFEVSILTRSTSAKAIPFPPTVTVIRTDYTPQSLIKVFAGIDAVVSCIATFSTHEQKAIIESAIAAGVKRFIPSEYGVDTSHPNILTHLPPAADKVNTVAHLRSRESTGLSWTAIIVGAFFDSSFATPGLMGWDVPGRKATIFDGGDVRYEASNVAQVGRAVAAVLAPQNLAATRNRYVFVNSFTTTQNEVLRALERHCGGGARFEVTHVSAREVAELGRGQLEKGEWVELGGGRYLRGSAEMIFAAIYGDGGVNCYSGVEGEGLWNRRLGLEEGESVDETVRRVVKGEEGGTGGTMEV